MRGTGVTLDRVRDGRMGGKKEGGGGRGRAVRAAFNNKRKEVEPKFYSVEEENEAVDKTSKTRQIKCKKKLQKRTLDRKLLRLCLIYQYKPAQN